MSSPPPFLLAEWHGVGLLDGGERRHGEGKAHHGCVRQTVQEDGGGREAMGHAVGAVRGRQDKSMNVKQNT